MGRREYCPELVPRTPFPPQLQSAVLVQVQLSNAQAPVDLLLVLRSSSSIIIDTRTFTRLCALTSDKAMVQGIQVRVLLVHTIQSTSTIPCGIEELLTCFY
jgi:hypothetical protein